MKLSMCVPMKAFWARMEKIDLTKFVPITFDPVHNTYRKLGDVVGKAFSDGLKLK